MPTLPEPRIAGCFFDDGFAPRLAAMHLVWPEPTGTRTRSWHLPQGVTLTGATPERFGIRIQRLSTCDYQLWVLWDNICLRWSPVRAAEIRAGCLAGLLSAIGSDLEGMLGQPVTADGESLPRVA
jgi:hypothetical protein